jgi:hypothetical protein
MHIEHAQQANDGGIMRSISSGSCSGFIGVGMKHIENFADVTGHAFITRPVAGLQRSISARFILDRAVVIKVPALIIKDPVKRVQRTSWKVIFAALTRQREQLVEQEGRGDHRRPAVELIPVDLVLIRTPADLVAFLK